MNEDVTLKTHDLRVNGITLHYCTWGEFTRPERTALVVHGLTSSSQFWTSFGPHLARSRPMAMASPFTSTICSRCATNSVCRRYIS